MWDLHAGLFSCFHTDVDVDVDVVGERTIYFELDQLHGIQFIG